MEPTSGRSHLSITITYPSISSSDKMTEAVSLAGDLLESIDPALYSSLKGDISFKLDASSIDSFCVRSFGSIGSMPSSSSSVPDEGEDIRLPPNVIRLFTEGKKPVIYSIYQQIETLCFEISCAPEVEGLSLKYLAKIRSMLCTIQQILRALTIEGHCNPHDMDELIRSMDGSSPDEYRAFQEISNMSKAGDHCDPHVMGDLIRAMGSVPYGEFEAFQILKNRLVKLQQEITVVSRISSIARSLLCITTSTQVCGVMTQINESRLDLVGKKGEDN
ncbi:MAG: hypothetical protein HY860_02330 [Chlamydiales bacterium]|nr:hypothetical protein [Chlamydiales bacterium]